jgi:spore maturation protein CgeB
MFAVQPAIHSPSPSDPRHARACFVGSYSRHIHPRRRWWQDMMFQAARELGVTVFDRNSSRHSHNYRFPDQPWLELRGSVPHEETAKIYRDFMVSLNVNTIEDSGTMFSRRLIEILACGGVAVSNPSPAIDRFFKDYCEVVHSREECSQLFDRLRRGLTPSDRERARAAVEYVLREHTWTRRLQEIECAAL